MPPGWRWANLGELAAFVNGAAFKPTDWVAEGIPIIRIQNLTNPSAKINRTIRVVPDKYIVEPGDLLVSWSATLDVFIWNGETAWLNQHIFRVTPNEEIVDPRYLFYLLKHEIEALKKSEHLHGSTMMHINRKPFLAHRFPFPPCLATQRRIVARIDELVSELDDGDTALARARGELNIYRKALLKSAVTGELTADWRAAHLPKETGADLIQRILAERRMQWGADPLNNSKRYKEPTPPDKSNLGELPEGWNWASIDQLSVRVTKGSSPGWQGFDYQDDGVLFIRSQNVGWGNLRLKDRVYLDRRFNEIERKAIVQPGDVLLNIVGASIGRACKADERLEGANTNQAVAGIRLVSKELSNFLVSWLVSPAGQHAVFKNVVETARANLSLEQVRAIAVPLPPGAEIAAVETAFGTVEAENAEILATVNENEALADDLRQSILAAAFRGDLIP